MTKVRRFKAIPLLLAFLMLVASCEKSAYQKSYPEDAKSGSEPDYEAIDRFDTSDITNASEAIEEWNDWLDSESIENPIQTGVDLEIILEMSTEDRWSMLADSSLLSDEQLGVIENFRNNFESGMAYGEAADYLVSQMQSVNNTGTSAQNAAAENIIATVSTMADYDNPNYPLIQTALFDPCTDAQASVLLATASLCLAATPVGAAIAIGGLILASSSYSDNC